MNPLDTLKLRDIHLPDGLSWWPPAIGWWVSLLLLIIIVVALILFIRKITRPSLKKMARAIVEEVIDDYSLHNDQLRLIQQFSIALRRIGMSYLPRNKTAGVSGRDWYQQLNQLAESKPLTDNTVQILLELPYQRERLLDEQQIDTLQSQVRSWVSGLAVR